MRLGAARARGSLIDGMIDADATVAGIVVAVLVVSAVLYVFFGMGREDERKR